MVATVTGNSLGLSLTSLATLNGQGSGGNAALGRSGEGVYVNTATGNLVVQDRDELVVSRGFDALALRTYNSQGLLSDDNADNWSNGIYAQMVKLASGTLNAAGSTLVRTERDGAQATYSYNATLAAYVSSDGVGAFDRIVYETAGTRFTWTDGDSGLQERYDAAGKITASIDPLGGSLAYTYTGNLLTLVTDASGEKLYFDYTAGTNNLAQLRTVRSDGTTLTRVRYGYDTSNRLTSVTVDLSPEDNAIVDGKTYVTSYTYDGTSKRIASITQTDGSLISFVHTLDAASGLYRVTRMVQTSATGVTRTTDFSYVTGNTTATANAGALSTAGSATSPLTGTLSTAGSSSLTGASTTPATGTLNNGQLSTAGSSGLNTAQLSTAGSSSLTAPLSTTDTSNRTGTLSTTDSNPIVTALSTAGSVNRVGPLVTTAWSSLRWEVFTTIWGTDDGDIIFYQVPGDPENGIPGPTWAELTQILYGVSPADSESAGQTLLEIWEAPYYGMDWSAPRLLPGLRINPQRIPEVLAYAVTPYYSVPAGATWNSIAQTLYGTSHPGAGSALQAQLGNPALTPGARLYNVPDTLSYTSPPYYTVKSTDNWTSITQTLYGTTRDEAVTALRARFGNPTLAPGLKLYDVQPTLTYNVPGYYTVPPGATWESITQDLYGTNLSGAAGVLRTQQGNPTLVAGLRLLNLPPSIQYTSPPYYVVPPNSSWSTIAQTLYGTSAAAGALQTAVGNPTLSTGLKLYGIPTTLDHSVPPYYTVSDPSWDSVALALYGTNATNAVSALQAALPGVTLSAGLKLSGLPATLNYAVAPYYTVTTPTWAAVALAVYGATEPSAATALQSAMGNPPLTAGLKLVNLPSSLGYTIPPSYTVPAGASWESITLALYGTNESNAATALRTQLGSPTLTTGLKLNNLPATLNYTVAAYYSVPAGASWSSITYALYGTSAAAAESALQAQQGNPPLTTGLKLTGLPSNLTYGTTVAPYYTVQAGNTWTSITQAVYGTNVANAITALHAALGTPTLTTGLKLNLPATLTYFNGSPGLTTTVTDPLGNATVFTSDTAGRLVGIAGPLLNGSNPTVRYTYNSNGDLTSQTDAQGNVTTYTYDANGNQTSAVDALGNTVTRTFNAANKLLTETLSNTPVLVAGPGLSLSGGTAIKTGTSAVFDAGFRSDIGYVGGAAISFSPTQANKSLAIGLNTDPVTDNGRASIDFALHCTATGTLFTYQNGDNKGQIGTYVAGDVLAIVYDGTTVKYYKNGVVLKTVNVVITQPLYADASFYDNGAQVTGIAFGTQVSTPVAPTFTTSGAFTLVGGTATKTGTTAAFDAGFRSTNGYLGPVGVSFTATAINKSIAIGLNTDPATDSGRSSIDYALHLAADGALFTYQNGVGKGQIGTYVAGDVLGVAYDGIAIRYYKNGVALKTVVVAITQPLYIDSSFYTTGAQVTNLTVGTTLFGMLPLPGSTTTRYAYDSSNNLRYVVSAEGRVTEYKYNSYGQRTASIDYADSSYVVSGASSNATIAEAALNTWRDALTEAQKRATVRVDTVYDFRGQVDKVVRYNSVDAAGAGVTTDASTTQYIYDQAGNLLKTIEPKGVATTGVATDFVTQYFYDGLSRVYKFTDALGITTLTDYQDANARTVVTLANGLSTTRTYNKAGELISVLQSDGATALGTTSYAYDKNGNLKRVTDPTGLSTYSLYDSGGRKVADIDGTGSLIEYVYNQNGLVARTVRYATAVSGTKLDDLANDINGNTNLVTLATLKSDLTLTAGDRTTRLVYDKANRLSKSIDELGFVTETQYNAAGQVLAVVRYDTALTPANLAAITPATLPTDAATMPVLNAALDRSTRYFYDAEGKATGNLDAEGYLTENQYDSAGRLVHTVRYATPTTVALRLTGTLAQLKQAIADPIKDIHTWTTYNAQNQVLRSLDGEGYLTMYAYDLNGNQTLSTRYNRPQSQVQPNTLTSNAPLAALAPETDAQDHTSSWTYTDLNQIKTATDFQGTVTQFSYDNLGQLVKTEKAFGTAELRVLQTRYDKLGRVVGELTAEGGAAMAALSAPTQIQIDAVWTQYGLIHAYDAAGRRISTTDQNGFKTLFFYNADGDLAATINALGQVTETKYNALNQAEQTTLFGTRLSTATLTGGQVSAISGAIAALTNATIDAKTSQTYTLRGQVATTTDARTNTNSFTYSAFGDLATSNTKIDAAGTLVTTGYTYDRLGQLKQTVFDAASLNITSSTDYDAFGRAITRTDGNLKSSSIAYDRLGRVVQTTDPLNIKRSTTYDAFSRTLSITDGISTTNTTSFAYNKGTRTVTMTTPEGIQTVTTANRHGETVVLKDGNQSITTYAYDLNGQLKTRIEDDGAGKLNLITRNNYDRAGRLNDTESGGTKTAYTYDAIDRVLTLRVDPQGLNLTTVYNYDPDAQGQRHTVTDPSGVVTTTRFDLDGNTTEVAIDKTGLNLRTQYTYDPRGNALTVTQGAGSTSPQVTKYEYDRAGRLSRESRDPLGLNLTVASYTYDKNDNVVNRTDGNLGLTRYAYDADNRLVYTVDPLGAVTKLEYDKEDRVTRTVAFKTFISLTALSTAPSVADIDARVTPNTTDESTRTVYDKDGRAVFSIDALNQVTRKTYDNNGNVTALTRYAAPITLPGTLSVANLQTAVNAIASTANDRVSKFVYDAANRQTLSVDPAGGITEISYDAAGHVTATKQYFKVLPAGSALSTIPTLVDAARDRITRYGYDAAGRQTLQVDGAGGVTETLYDQASRIIGIKQYANALPAGSALSQVSTLGDASRDHLTRYGYDTAGRQKISVDATGDITETQYDAAGNVVGLKQYANVLPAGTALSLATSFADPARDHLSRFGYDAAGRQIYSVDAAGAAIQTAYDAVGHVVSTRQYATALSAGAALSDIPNLANGVNKADDRITRYAYDANGRQTIEVDATNAITQTTYDALGNVDSTRRYVKTLPGGSPLAQVALLVDADDRITRYAYDVKGRQVLLIDGSGAITEKAYDAFGNVKSTRQYANTVPSGDVLQVWHRNGTNNSAHVLLGTFKTGDVVTATVRFKTTAGATANMFLGDAGGPDPYDNAVATGSVIANGEWQTLTLTRTMTHDDTMWVYVYADYEGTDNTRSVIFDNLVVSSAQRGVTLDDNFDNLTFGPAIGQWTNDSFTQSATVSLADAGTDPQLRTLIARLADTARDRITDYTYDGAGRVKTVRDALGLTESYTYDGLGNKTSFTNKKGSIWTYLYDAAGRLQKETSPQVSITSLGNNDGFGNLTLGASTNVSIDTLLAYDAFGNITARTEAAGLGEQRTTTYAYDALNRQVKVTYPTVKVYRPENAAQLAANGQSGLAVASEEDKALSTQTFYDVFGNAVANIDVAGGASYKLHDAMGRVRYAVDAMGYVTEYKLNTFGEVSALTRYSATTTLANTLPVSAASAPAAALVVSALGGDRSTDRTIITTYDTMGRVKLVTEPVVFNYDSTTNTYDTAAGKKTQNTYNAFGDLVQQAVSRTSTTWTYTARHYDKTGRQTDVVDAMGNVTRYAYDAVGNLTQLSEFVNKVAPAGQGTWVNAPGAIATTLSDRITVYTYDKDNRKTREERRNVENWSIAPEANGNYTPVAGESTVATSYGYDAVGNLTRTTDANGANTYSYYDAVGRVTAVAAPMRNSTVSGAALTPITLFKRDAHGNVIAKIELANGANAASEFTDVPTTTQTGYPATAPSDDDHRTLYKYDLLGHEIQNTDATGVSHYTSYNERGDVAKTWQGITYGSPVYENGRLKVDSTWFQAYQYDKAGRLTRIVDPAPRGSADLRMVAPQLVSSAYAFDTYYGDNTRTSLSGTNTVVTRWSNLIDPQGDSVRVEMVYQTLSTLPFGGMESHAATYTSPDTAAADAGGGLTLSWNDYDTLDGGISGIHALTVSQRVNGVWIVKWHGAPAQATGDSIIETSQSAAGVIETVQQYNAFGEMIYKDKGINASKPLSGQQEYFKYDNAGRLWGTNSGDGVDRVLFYDLQGHVTSVISSSGSGAGGANTAITGLQQASDASHLGNDRRTNLHYDAIGHVIKQVELPPVTTQDSVIARGLSADFSVSSRNTVYEIGHVTDGEHTFAEWEARWTNVPNVITASWTDLASLGPGDVRVKLSYTTESYVARPAETYEDTYIPEVIRPSIPREKTWIFSSAQAATGASLMWWDEDVVDAGVGSITSLIVEKQDAVGRWVTVMDRSTSGYYGDALEMAIPRDGIHVTAIQYHRPGSSDANYWTSASVDFGEFLRLDPSRLSLSAGSYEYRVLKIPIGQLEDGVLPPSATARTVAGTPPFTVVGPSTFTVGSTANRLDRTTTLPPTIHQTVDRWGNVTTRSDVRNADWLTKFTYDINNQLTSQTETQANGSGFDGGVTTYYHDKLGQQIGVKDARGNINGQRFDAGGNLVEEFHADGGRITHLYDAFGNRLRTTDAVGNETAALKADHTTAFAYDKAGRLLTTTHAPVAVYATSNPGSLYEGIPFSGGALQTLVETNTYDQAGRKISQTNAANETARYRYDLAGHLIESIDAMSNTTRMIYDRFGYKVREVDALGFSQSWTYDYFGQLTGHTDLGGAGYSYTYDNARQLTDQTSTRGQRLKYGYDITGRNTSIVDSSLNQTTAYTYDLAGNRTGEKTVQDGVTYQDNHLTYDALGRLRDVSDGRMHVGIDYDAVGNRMRISSFSYMSGPIPGEAPSNRHFQYDKMNRQVVVDSNSPTAALTDGNTSVHVIRYDKNGNRTADIFWGNRVWVTSPGHWFPYQYQADDGNWMWSVDWAPATYHSDKGWVQHTYTYDLLNRLTSVRYDNTVGSNVGTEVDTRLYDAAGRVVRKGVDSHTNDQYISYLNAGNEAGTLLSSVAEVYAYDKLGRLTNQRKYYPRWWDPVLNVDNDYNWVQHDGAAYAYDAVSNVARLWFDQTGSHTNDYTYTNYQRFDGYMADTIEGISSKLAPSNTNNVYDKNGRLVGYYNAGVPRTLINDASGFVLYAEQGGQVQRQVVVNGEVLARYGYADSAAVNDFNFSYDFNNSEGAAPGRYTVQAGDTLRAIARAVYGDAAQWYLIAAANGLAGEFDIRAGQTLALPYAQAGTHNNVDTVKPYDPSHVNGNVLPNLSPIEKGCSNGGAAVLQIVVMVISYYVAGETGSYTVGNFVGSLAGQLFMKELDYQDDINWKAVGMSTAAGLIQDVTYFPADGLLSNPYVQAAVTNAVTQGVAIAIGVQDEFSWRSLAASVAGVAAGQMMDELLDSLGMGATEMNTQSEWAAYQVRAANGLSGFASRITVAAFQGGKFNARQVAVDAFGNLLASSLVNAMQPQTQGQGPWSDADYRNEYDIASDNYVAPAGTSAGGRAWNDDVSARVAAGSTDQIIRAHFAKEDAARAYSTQAAKSMMEDAAAVGAYTRRFVAGIDAARAVDQAVTASYAYDDTPTWNMRDANAALKYRPPESTFSFGFAGGNRTVLDTLDVTITPQEKIGRALGEAWAGTKNTVYGMTGARSIHLAMSDWQAGNYGSSLLHGMQSLGEAGMTLLGVGVGSVRNSAAAMAFPGGEATGIARATYVGNAEFGAGRTLGTYTGDVYSLDFVGPVQWKYFYRGDATARTDFLSSMAQERGVRATTEFLDSRASGTLSDIYAQHGVGSQGLPTIGASDTRSVAEYFARGPSQTQNGFVTTFRIESREAERVAIPNWDNPLSFEMPNPYIGLPEREFLFHPLIDPKYIVKQVPVGPR